jgi:hypothetical protein
LPMTGRELVVSGAAVPVAVESPVVAEIGDEGAAALVLGDEDKASLLASAWAEAIVVGSCDVDATSRSEESRGHANRMTGVDVGSSFRFFAGRAIWASVDAVVLPLLVDRLVPPDALLSLMGQVPFDGVPAAPSICAKSIVPAVAVSTQRGGGEVSFGADATGCAFIVGPCPATLRSKGHAIPGGALTR